MTTTIITKNSSTASAVPLAADLVQGELAVNVTDKRLFTQNASDVVVELGTTPSSVTTGAVACTTLAASGNVTLGDASTDTLNVGNGGIVKDASGNVGIGTSSPSRRLQVQTATTGNVDAISWSDNSTDTGYLGIASGGGARLWAGGFLALGAGGGASFTERARIDSSNNLLVGTTTAGAGIGFDIRFAVDGGSGEAGIFKTSGGASSYSTRVWNSATTGNNLFTQFATEANGTTRGSITYNRGGGLTAYNVTSDYRSKTVNGPVQDALSKVSALKPSTGRMNGAEYDIDFFVAHELQAIVPSAVTGEKDDVNEDGSPKYQMVDKSALIPLLTAAIQEQQALINAQQAALTTLTERITALEAK